MRTLHLLIFLMVLRITSFSQNIKIEYPAPGSVHPNVKYIDADELSCFSKGAAVIGKGRTTALIDSAGNKIVPFGKYYLYGVKIYSQDEERDRFSTSYSNGLFVASKSVTDNFTFLINSNGKLLFTAPPGYQLVPRGTSYGDNAPVDLEVGTIPKDNRASMIYQKNSVSISYNGNMTYFPSYSDKKWGEGLYAYLDKVTKKWGYKNEKNNIVIPPQYDWANRFSNGLAVVAKNDEFKQLKFGYINPDGKVIIPLRYSIEPGAFGNNLAWVVPKNNEEFKMAFINKAGDIVLKIAAESPIGGSRLTFQNTVSDREVIDNKFANGYFIYNSFKDGLCLMDTLGKVISLRQFFNIDNEQFKKLTIHHMPFYNNQMKFSERITNGIGKGMLFFDSRTSLPPIFQELSFFDNVSNLAYAKLSKGKNSTTNKEEILEGYVNRQGVFVLLKKNEEKW